jgi:hypothetical protein
LLPQQPLKLPGHRGSGVFLVSFLDELSLVSALINLHGQVGRRWPRGKPGMFMRVKANILATLLGPDHEPANLRWLGADTATGWEVYAAWLEKVGAPQAANWPLALAGFLHEAWPGHAGCIQDLAPWPQLPGPVPAAQPGPVPAAQPGHVHAAAAVRVPLVPAAAGPPLPPAAAFAWPPVAGAQPAWPPPAPVPAPAPVPPPFKAAPPGNAPRQATVPCKAPPPPPGTGPAAVPAPAPGPAPAPAPAGEWQHGAWQQGWDQGWNEGWTCQQGWDQGWNEGWTWGWNWDQEWLAPGPVEPDPAASASTGPASPLPAGPDQFGLDDHVVIVDTDRAGDYGRIHSYRGTWFNVRMDTDSKLLSFHAENLVAAGPAPGPGLAPPPFKAAAPGPATPPFKAAPPGPGLAPPPFKAAAPGAATPPFKAAPPGPGLAPPPFKAAAPDPAPPPFKAAPPGPGLATAAARPPTASSASSVRTNHGSDPLTPGRPVPKTAQWLGGVDRL